MNPAYQHVAVADLQPGMVLSDELLDKQGQVLLPQDAVLTARTIALLPAHGIEAVAVRFETAPASPKNTKVIEERLAHLFRQRAPDQPEDWATGILHTYMLDYRLEREPQA